MSRCWSDRSQAHRGGLRAAYATVLFLALAPLPAYAQGGTVPEVVVPEETGECTLGEPVLRVLRDERGRPFFVEPQSVLPGENGELLLLGTPTYVYEEVDSVFELVERGGYTGALIRGGSGALLAAPEGVEEPAVFRGVRTPGGWAAIFSSDPASRRYQGRMWFAETDGHRWSTPTEVPLPGELPFDPYTTSDLVTTPGGFAAAVILQDPVPLPHVAVLRGGRRGWSGENVADVRGGRTAMIGRGDRPPLLVVAGPEDFTSRGRLVRVLDSGPPWAVVHRISIDSPRVFGRHAVFTAGSDAFLTWSAPTAEDGPSRLWTARVAGTPPRVDTPRVLGGAAAGWAALAHEGRPAWIVLRPSETHPLGELRVLVQRGDRVVVAGSFPSPFLGPFGAASLDDGRLVLIGPDFRDDPLHQAVLSLRVDVRLACR